MLWSTEEVFTQFGPSRYMRRRSPTELQLDTDYAAVRAQLRERCPQVPGVYGMLDCGGRLVYVGMSRNLRNRLVTYFQQSENRRRKESRIAQRARRLLWETAGHELLAQLREYELIRRFLPELNVRDRRSRQSVYLYLTNGDAPRFKLGTQLPKWCQTSWGPLQRRGLEKSVDLLNRHFLLADCNRDVVMHFREERSLFPLELYPKCLRGEMRQCVAPCAGYVTRTQYAEQLERAVAFLHGREEGPLDELCQAMQRAVATRQYEIAAQLRDARETLIELRTRLRPGPDLLPESFVYRLQRGRQWHWLLVERGRVCRVTPTPNTERSAAAWNLSWRTSVDQSQLNNDARSEAERRILTAWFRCHPEELNAVIDLPTARRLCQSVNKPR